MEHQKIDLLFNLRSHKILHYSVVIITASVIIFVYYSYKNSLPTPPGHYLGWFWDIFYFEFRNKVLGILLNVPILYSTITLGWKRSFIILLILLACIAPYIIAFSFNTYTLLVSFSGLIILPTIIISSEIKLISDAKERIAEAGKKRERAEFMRQMFSMQEDERKRMSQELHDGVAQTLLVNASLAHNMLENNKIHYGTMKTDLEVIKKNSLNMVAEIRCICQDLRPSILDNLGFVSSIKWLIDNLHEETGINVEFSLKGSVYELSQDESVALFRIVQETLNNIKKHAEANIVDIHIGFLNSAVSIRIKDNGRGFELPNNINSLALSGKLGILGMHERAKSIGATLEIISNVSAGTEVRISLKRNKTGRFPVTIA